MSADFIEERIIEKRMVKIELNEEIELCDD